MLLIFITLRISRCLILNFSFLIRSANAKGTAFGYPAEVKPLVPIVIPGLINAAASSGINIALTTIGVMAFSGMLAGLAGVTEVLGKYGRFIDGFSPGFGFTGIAVAVLGSNNPFGILLTSLLFGALEAGSMKMSYVANVSTNMVMVIQGLVILFVATPEIVSQIVRRKRGTRNG